MIITIVTITIITVITIIIIISMIIVFSTIVSIIATSIRPLSPNEAEHNDVVHFICFHVLLNTKTPEHKVCLE